MAKYGVFLVRIFENRENKDQKKLRIWTLFTQWETTALNPLYLQINLHFIVITFIIIVNHLYWLFHLFTGCSLEGTGKWNGDMFVVQSYHLLEFQLSQLYGMKSWRLHQTRHVTRGRGRGEVSPAFFENWKKCLNFGEKRPDWGHLRVKFLFSSGIIKSFQEKKT